VSRQSLDFLRSMRESYIRDDSFRRLSRLQISQWIFIVELKCFVLFGCSINDTLQRFVNFIINSIFHNLYCQFTII
jgi:hypothetical protein